MNVPFPIMKIGNNVFIAYNATVVGDVTIEDDSFILYGAVLRGDQNSICIGKGSNIQDNVVVHVDAENPTTLGENVSVGHGAIIHGSTIGSNALIGMGAILLSGSVVEQGAVIGAGTIVTSGMVIGRGCLAVGSPARVLRCDPSIEEMGRKNGAIYRNLKYQHSQGIYSRYIP
jgi:carbonic anhydrase/acetyltransferase-like protein (isoleucine patch superfamily)